MNSSQRSLTRQLPKAVTVVAFVAALALACSAVAEIDTNEAAGAAAAATSSPVTAQPEPSQAPADPTPVPDPTQPPADATQPPADATEPADPTAPPAPTETPAFVQGIPGNGPAGPCGAPPLALPNPDRPSYSGIIDVDPEAGTVAGNLQVTFVPDLATDEVIVRLWPNGPRTSQAGVNSTLNGATIDGEPVEIEQRSLTLVALPLAEPLAAGDRVVVDLAFEAIVPVELKSRLSGRADYMRLGTILPLLPWEPGVGWATDPPTSLFAEAVSSPTADYEIRVIVPEGFDVLASGEVSADGTWTMSAGRDFALSVGRFRTVTGTAMAPEPVSITVGVHETVDDDPQVYLDKIIASLEQFSQRFGQYPWPSLTFAITPNLSGGIEFPTHIMQGPDTQGRVTSHEIGHMFFYSLVGNNQGTEPWLDEGITSYAEFTFEQTAPYSWEIPAAGQGLATQPMTYWEDNSSVYYRSVYGQTGFALQSLGEQAEVDCALAHYVAANAYGIATAAEFVEAFTPRFPDLINELQALGVDLS